MTVDATTYPVPEYYPSWGPIDMRFSERFRQVVGTLTEQGAGPAGTFFVVQEEMAGWMGERDRKVVRWMVTARHAIEGAYVDAKMLDRQGVPHSWDVTDGWLFPWPDAKLTKNDPGFDLAVRLFDPPVDSQLFFALPTALSVRDTERTVDETGRPVYFAGLYNLHDWQDRDIVPVVRSGSVAAIDQQGIYWEHGGWWTAGHVHLIDVRSKSGFSGSPVFAQFYIPTTEKSDWPPVWYRMAERAGNDPAKAGGLHTFTHWWGMFISHDADSGIGSVIRDVDIIDYLGMPEVLEVKEQEEQQIQEEEESGGMLGQAADG